MSARAGRFLIRVMPLVIAFLLGLTPALGLADTIKIGGTGAALGTMRVLGEAFHRIHPDANVVIVPGLGSSGGRKALFGGAVDIAVTSRAGNSVEKLEGAVAMLYGRSPFVFAASKKNLVSALTTQELVEIWNGKRTTWSDGTRLRLILRPATDSDTDVLRGISPAMEEAVKAALARPGMKIALTDDDAANDIETIPGALGTSLLSLIIGERRSLKPLLLDGIEPSVKNIAGGSYRYFKSLYVLTRAKPSGLAQQFVAFLSSARGHEILGQLGHWAVEGKAGQ